MSSGFTNIGLPRLLEKQLDADQDESFPGVGRSWTAILWKRALAAFPRVTKAYPARPKKKPGSEPGLKSMHVRKNRPHFSRGRPMRNDNPTQAFTSMIRGLREAGLKPSEIAQRSGISRQQLWRWKILLVASRRF
jgi:hypothetical protein